MSGGQRETVKRSYVPFWMIWANPIVRRYARSRLRPTGFGVSLLLVVLISGFVFFVSREGSGRVMASPEDVARVALFPLLMIQGIILFGLGTGQVAGAMTGEADEGVLDYQRLAPMSPLAKVLGYLFGLPIREWVLFAATMPFTIISLLEGEVPLQYAFQLYAVFVMAAVLYHLTGLLTGTVMKNRRWAFLGSMGLVLLLYTIIPQAAKFGLVYFKYLTIYPVVEEMMPHFTPRRLGQLVDAYQMMVPQAKFFGLDLSQYVVTLVSQAVLSFAMIVMLWRHWRKAESHLLGKLGAVGLFAWLQIVLLGNALPLIDGGDIFPSRELRRRFGRILNPQSEFWKPEIEEAVMMVGLFGVVTMGVMWWMTLIISPSRDTQIRGWRRVRKFGGSKLPILSDAATSFPWVFAMAGIGVTGWYIFADAILDSRWYPGQELSTIALPAMVIVALSGGWALQALLETRGRKAAGLALIFVGVIPVMLAIIMGVSGGLVSPAVWMAGICPVSWPVYGAGLFIPDSGMLRDVARALPNAFWFWQGVALLVTGWLLVKLRESRSKISRESMD